MNFTKTLSDLDSGDADSFIVRSCVTVPIGLLSFSILIGGGGVTWVLMVAGSAGWQLAWIAILFAYRPLLVLFDDVDLVDRRFFGVCWMRASDAGSDLVK